MEAHGQGRPDRRSRVRERQRRPGVREGHRLHRLSLAGNHAVLHQRRDPATERILTPGPPAWGFPPGGLFSWRARETNEREAGGPPRGGPLPVFYGRLLRARPFKWGRAAPSPSRPSPGGRSRAVSPTFRARVACRSLACAGREIPLWRGPALTASPRSLARA